MRQRRVLLGSVCLAALLGVPLAASAEQAGVAAAVNPAASGTPPGLPTRVLSLGADIARNERIATDPGGLTQILFNDGTSLSIGPDADVVIDDYAYDPAKGTGTMALSLGKGALRLIGGRIANADQVTVKTPSATVGIRGGIAGVAVDDQGGTTSYLAFGTNMTVQGANGSSQSVNRPNFTITVAKPGDAPQEPVPLTQTVLQNVSVDPPAGSTGGSNSRPTETSVQNGGSGARDAVAGPRGIALGAVNSSGFSTNDLREITRTAAQQQTADQAASTGGGLMPNTTYGPFFSGTYLNSDPSIVFTTDAAGDVDTLVSGSGGSSLYAAKRIGAPAYVATLGQAQIAIWNGYTNNSLATGPNPFGNLPSVFIAGVPTTLLPQSGSTAYQVFASTPIVDTSFSDVNAGNYRASIIGGSGFAGVLNAKFGNGGPNTAQLDLEGRLIIPGDGGLQISAPYIVNNALTSIAGFKGVGGSSVTPVGTSRYCGAGGFCQLYGLSGFFTGKGNQLQIVLDYYLGYGGSGRSNGELSGAVLFRAGASNAGPLVAATGTGSFVPNAVLPAVGYQLIGGTAFPSDVVVVTDAAGTAVSAPNADINRATQIREPGGDAYVQVSRLIGPVKFDASSTPFTYPASGGLPELFAIPTVGSLPGSGTVSYNLLAATKPVYTDGYGSNLTAATFDGSAAVTAAFTKSGANLHFSSLTLSGPDTSGSTVILNAFDVTNVTKATFTGTTTGSAFSSHICTGASCGASATIGGLFAGPDARRLGIAYAVYGNSYAQLIGTAAFRSPGAVK